MKRWAVGYWNSFDNTLTVEIVRAKGWPQAISEHTLTSGVDFNMEDLEEAKMDFFNCDAGVDVKLIED